jgi:hypothetical protein
VGSPVDVQTRSGAHLEGEMDHHQGLVLVQSILHYCHHRWQCLEWVSVSLLIAVWFRRVLVCVLTTLCFSLLHIVSTGQVKGLTDKVSCIRFGKTKVPNPNTDRDLLSCEDPSISPNASVWRRFTNYGFVFFTWLCFSSGYPPITTLHSCYPSPIGGAIL